MQTVCTLLQTDNHANTSSLNFYRPDALPAAQPTVSKHWRQIDVQKYAKNKQQPCQLQRARRWRRQAAEWVTTTATASTTTGAIQRRVYRARLQTPAQRTDSPLTVRAFWFVSIQKTNWTELNWTPVCSEHALSNRERKCADTWSEATSPSLWSRHDRHFVGI